MSELGIAAAVVTIHEPKLVLGSVLLLLAGGVFFGILGWALFSKDSIRRVYPRG